MDMTDYKRMVSYMYLYENGIKKKNVGFARIEVKDGQCRFTLHMQLLGQLDGIFPTYLIERTSDGMELIYLGDSILKNQIMDSKLSAKEGNIMDTGRSLAEIGGMLLFLNDSIFFATEWDDKPILHKEVLTAMKPKEKKEPEMTLEEELQIPKYKLPRGYKIIERMQGEKKVVEVLAADSESKANAMLAADSKNKADEVLAADSKSKADAVAVAVAVVEEEVEEKFTLEEKLTEEKQSTELEEILQNMMEETVPDDFSAINDQEVQPAQMQEELDPAIVREIFENNPRIYPFEDNEILICAKIEPKDIGLLPKELWALSNNSFLMHGYYCYHHLILAKLKDRYGCRFILGVPGIYHNRERFMAKMFGFDGFKPIRKRELRQGDFGYWYLPVSL
jgi:hypothetical protein